MLEPREVRPSVVEAGPPLVVSHVRGIIVAVVRQAMLRQVPDPSAWQAFLQSLSPACREVFAREVGEYEWVAMGVLGEASARFQSFPGGDIVALRGALYAEQMLTRSHQWMLKVMTPELLLRQCPRIFSFYHRGGQVWSEEISPGRGCIALRAKGPSPGWAELLLPSWMRRALELCGAKEIQVAHEPPSDPAEPYLHRYWMSWV